MVGHDGRPKPMVGRHPAGYVSNDLSRTVRVSESHLVREFVANSVNGQDITGLAGIGFQLAA
jgi:hypothetical protein